MIGTSIDAADALPLLKHAIDISKYEYITLFYCQFWKDIKTRSLTQKRKVNF